jgi:drug/metabolite transporter (DMT)-like permease
VIDPDRPMTHWYTMALISLLLLSAQRFLYKVAAEKRCSTHWTTFSFFATVAVFSSGLFALTAEPTGDTGVLIFIALVNSVAFLTATVTHIESLKYLPAAECYSIIRLNVVLVVIFSVVFLGDRPAISQVAGIVLAVVVIRLLTRQDLEAGAIRNAKKGLPLVFISMACGAAASVSSKFAALSVGKFAFMSVSYIFSALLSVALRNRLYPETENGRVRDAVMIGFVMGVLNLAGYYAFLSALSTGPLSAIALITGMHFVVAIALSALIYRERLTPVKLIGVVLTVISVILLRN